MGHRHVVGFSRQPVEDQLTRCHSDSGAVRWHQAQQLVEVAGAVAETRPGSVKGHPRYKRPRDVPGLQLECVSGRLWEAETVLFHCTDGWMQCERAIGRRARHCESVPAEAVCQALERQLERHRSIEEDQPRTT